MLCLVGLVDLVVLAVYDWDLDLDWDGNSDLDWNVEWDWNSDLDWNLACDCVSGWFDGSGRVWLVWWVCFFVGDLVGLVDPVFLALWGV